MDVIIRTIYGIKNPGPKVSCGKSMAQQNFKAECDINNIMKKYETTGYLTDPLNPGTRQPLFGDYTDLPDYQTAQNIIVEGREAFASLPSRLRKRFDNDPVTLLQFLSDPANHDECVELGLIDADVELEPEPESKPRNLGVIPKEESE